MSWSFLIALALIGSVFCTTAYGRPEYAVRSGTSCVSCHASPWGGGPRTVYGKFFGSRNLGQGTYSGQDLFSASLREVAYYPNATSQSSSGMALMEASGSANAPVLQGSEKVPEIRLVATYNMSPLGAGPREAYARVMTPQSDSAPLYVTVGRFNAPFGLLTDEHRTYTRLQTNMTLNNFEDGVAVSGNLFPSLSYDLAIVNDFQGGGGFTSKDVTYGAIGNMRWQPSGLPFFLGISQNFEYSQIQPEPYATSIYTAISIDRLTSNFIDGSVLLEGVSARNWNGATVNPSIPFFFIPSTDSSYQTAVTSSQSLGFYGQAKWDVGKRWTLFYKFDSLQLNADFPGDVFIRHGVGCEVLLSSNLILNTRIERANATRPEVATSNALAAQDDFLAVLRLWL